MSTGLIKIMKQAASEAEDNAKPTEIRYGEVVSVDPLSVRITNQFTLPASVLIVPKHLTDYVVKVTIESEIPSEDGESTETTTTEATMTVHNALSVSDKVALLRQRGGQSYFILDRV